MLERIPTADDLRALLGDELHRVFEALCQAIDEKYDMDRLWDKGYRDWVYEYKYRRGGKTLCTIYLKTGVIGFQVIFGKDERVKVEARRAEFSGAAMKTYDEATTFHDGKWVMFLPTDTSMLGDFLGMLALKRRPNHK